MAGKDYGRVITAMVTPFDADLQVDYGRAAELARRLVEGGCDGLVVTGSTGEAATLSFAEKVRLYRTVVEAVGDRVFVWAGTGSNNTEETVRLSRAAAEAGVDGLLLVVPYYNKPPQASLERHFTRVADAVDIPVMLYNVPGRTATNMEPATVARLAQHPRIVALKESSGNLTQASAVRRACPDDFVIYSGDDDLTLPMLAVGARGVVSVAGNVVPGAIARMIAAFEAGDVAEARRLHLRLFPFFRALFVTSNPIPVKCALEIAGFPVGGLRQPLDAADEGVRRHLEQVMAEISDLLPG
ncbi:MAG: 4-hydroxy-tetrahydrodipicolinate synthase [Thermaerobacter sp.]|nr:4-hydroxy-tetrahydrodipicolinate synthase [Bacillota bacterium]